MRAFISILIVLAGSILCTAQVFEDSIDISAKVDIETAVAQILGPITEAINADAYISSYGSVYLPGSGVLLESRISELATLQDLQISLTDALQRVGDLVEEALAGEKLLVVTRNGSTGFPEGCFILDSIGLNASDLTDYYHPYDASAYSTLYKLSYLSNELAYSEAVSELDVYAYEYYFPGVGALIELSWWDLDDVLLTWGAEDWRSYFEDALGELGGVLLSDLAEGERLLITFEPSWSETDFLEIPVAAFGSPDEWVSYHIIIEF
jgi:hypothetical protein